MSKSMLLRLALPVALLCSASALRAQTTVTTIVNTPTSLTWIKSRTNDSITIGPNNVLFTEGQTSGSAFLTNSPAMSNLSTGDIVTLNYNFTLGTIGTSTNNFRFGIYNSGSTQLSSNYNASSNSNYSDDYGYIFNLKFDGTTRELYALQGAGNTSLLASTSGYQKLTVSSSGTSGAFQSGGSYVLSMTLERLINGYKFAALVNGGNFSNYTIQGSDISGNSAALTSFNELALYINGGTAAINTFNITGASLSVTSQTSAVPEPSTYALIAGAACLGLVVLRRRISLDTA